ncbi:MAG: riboflavin synthase [Gemmatimonadales bacterium]
MFTGIIAAVGVVDEATVVGEAFELLIATPWADITPGESVAVDGACLTAADVNEQHVRVQVVASSLDRTTFSKYVRGRRVNLERALRAGDRLGGHLVQGHVDGTGLVQQVQHRRSGHRMTIQVPPEVASVSIPLGSITVDGVSLTIDAIPAPDAVQVSLIPFTLQHTTLGERSPGDAVHLEGDTVGKYVQRFVAAWRGREPR